MRLKSLRIALASKPGSRWTVDSARDAVFARLNVIFHEEIMRWMLFKIPPRSRSSQGFPSYYDRCAPSDFRGLAGRYELHDMDRQYYQSTYFSFFSMHLVWRLRVLLFRMARGEQAAETFSIALMKQPCEKHSDKIENQSVTVQI
jgi:hypothetical protein